MFGGLYKYQLKAIKFAVVDFIFSFRGVYGLILVLLE